MNTTIENNGGSGNNATSNVYSKHNHHTTKISEVKKCKNSDNKNEKKKYILTKHSHHHHHQSKRKHSHSKWTSAYAHRPRDNNFITNISTNNQINNNNMSSCYKSNTNNTTKKRNNKVNDVNYFIQNEEYRTIGLGTTGLYASSVVPVHTLTIPRKKHKETIEQKQNATSDNEQMQVIPFYTPAFYRAEEPSYALRHATANEEEFKRWRKKNLRHSLYHTYTLTPRQNRELIASKVKVLKSEHGNNNNNNDNENMKCTFVENIDNNIGSKGDTEYEETRIRAIAKERAQQRIKRERQIREHEYELLALREKKIWGKPVDLPPSYYTIVVEQNRQLMPTSSTSHKNKNLYSINNSSNNNLKSVIVYKDNLLQEFTPTPPDPSTLNKMIDLSNITVKDHHNACQLAKVNREYVRSSIEEEKRNERQAVMKTTREQWEHAQEEQLAQRDKWMTLHGRHSQDELEQKHAEKECHTQKLINENKEEHWNWNEYAQHMKRIDADEELAKRMWLRWRVFHERPHQVKQHYKQLTPHEELSQQEKQKEKEKEYEEETENAQEQKAVAQEKLHSSHKPELSATHNRTSPELKDTNISLAIATSTPPDAAITTNVYCELKKWIQEESETQESKQLALLNSLTNTRLPSREGQRKAWLDSLEKDRIDFNAQTVRDYKTKYPELIYRSLNEHFNNKTHLASTMREIHSADVHRMNEWQREDEEYKCKLHKQQQLQEEKVNEVKTNLIAELQSNAAATRRENKLTENLLHLIAEEEKSELQMRVASARAAEHERENDK